jgi:hypothetical protein
LTLCSFCSSAARLPDSLSSPLSVSVGYFVSFVGYRQSEITDLEQMLFVILPLRFVAKS